MSQRFSYVKYDDQSTMLQNEFKDYFEDLEELAEELEDSRAKNLFLTYLEIAYMWSGKAIRDEQIARGVLPDDVPERTTE
jgi:hypothetical protein